jgi:hypothetical protein
MNPPINVSVAASSSATSGLQGNLKFGDIIAGGRKLSQPILLAAFGVVLLLGIAWILRR